MEILQKFSIFSISKTLLFRSVSFFFVKQSLNTHCAKKFIFTQMNGGVEYLSKNWIFLSTIVEKTNSSTLQQNELIKKTFIKYVCKRKNQRL
jgi:hypothetical protein